MAKSSPRKMVRKKPPAPLKAPVEASAETTAQPAEAAPDKPKEPVNEALINWAAVKRRYQNKRQMKVADIARHYGLTESRLREIARERRWLRPASRPKPRSKAPPTIKDRMLVIADGQVTQIEMLMEADVMPDIPETTRRLRDLNQMVGSPDPKKQGAADGAPQRASGTIATPGEIDAERWRHELAERIKKLKAKLEAL